MTIFVKAVCPEVLPAVRSGAYSAPEGATPEEVVEICLDICGRDGVPADYKKRLHFLRNGCRAEKDTPLSDGDKLYILRPLYGG